MHFPGVMCCSAILRDLAIASNRHRNTSYLSRYLGSLSRHLDLLPGHLERHGRHPDLNPMWTLSQAERCTAEMRSLTSELESAQPRLTLAAAAEDAAATACARCTPALLQESAALKQHLSESLPAATRLKAQLPHLHMVAADLKLMAAQVTPV